MNESVWDDVPVSVFYDGYELYSLLYDGDDPLPLWKPDIHFIDALQVEEFAGLMKLRPGKFSSTIFVSIYPH